MLRLAFLGGHQVAVDGELVRWRNRKSIALLGCLALDPQRCSKEWLAGLLWPDCTRTQSRTNLRNLVFHTRRALGNASSAVEDRGDVLSLASGSYDCDMDAFLSLAARAETGARALTLYHGEFLSGFDRNENDLFGEWLGNQRERLHRMYMTAVQTEYDRARVAGESDGALTLARRWVRDEAYDERARRALMRSLVRAGDRGGAAAAYREWAAFLARELGTTPDPATVALYTRIAEGETVPPPLPKVHPLFRPAFVGREEELAWLERESNAADGPLVLLLRGESGSGRTRLLTEYHAVLRAQGDIALFGRTPSAAAMPFQSLAEVVRAWFSDAPGDPGEILKAVSTVDLAELARLAPEIRLRLPDPPAPLPGWPPEVDRRLTLALAAVIVAMVRQATMLGRSLVLCLDDLDQSSEATLHAVSGLLSGSGAGARVQIVATTAGRDCVELRDWLREVRRLVSVRERSIGGLSEEDSGKLLRSMAGPGPQPVLASLAAFIHRRSGGMPLFTVELIRSLFDQGMLRTDVDGTWKPAPDLVERELSLPSSLIEVLREKLRHLPEAAHVLLRAASSMPEPFAVTRVTAESGLAAVVAAAMLEELLARRILSYAPGGFRFCQGLMRDLVREGKGSL